MINRAGSKEKAKQRMGRCKSGMIGANILTQFWNTASIAPFSVAMFGLVSMFLNILTASLGVSGGLGLASMGNIGNAIGLIATVGVFVVICAILLIIVITICLSAISGVAMMGNRRYYLYTTKHGLKPSLVITLDGFNDFWNVFLVYARKALVVLLYRLPGVVLFILGALLVSSATGAAIFMFVLGALVIWLGGWFANLQLWAVEWIKADRPELNSARCIAESKKMCKGHIGDLLLLQLSFIPWNLLNTFTGGLVGLLYYTPYYHQTCAFVYQELKQSSIELNEIENAEAIRGNATNPLNNIIDGANGTAGQRVTVGYVSGVTGSFAGKGKEITPDTPVVIGRGDSCEIHLAGAGTESVSGTHCVVRYKRENDTYEVIDKSSNGTFVNGERLPKGSPVYLPCGVVISLADDRNQIKLDKIAK